VTNAKAALRQNAGGVIVELLVNLVLPVIIYSYARGPLGDVKALLISSAPPIVWSAIQLAQKRRLDAVSLLVLTGIALSLLAFIGGGSVRFLQLRENLVTGLIGLVFLGSAVIGKPLIYQLARANMRRKSAEDAESFERLKTNAMFRRTMTLMTVVWGVGLIAQTAVACVLVFALSIRDYLIVSPIIGYGTMGALALWTFWYSKRARRLGEARRAAELISR
jgi:intracellular septation protein A